MRWIEEAWRWLLRGESDGQGPDPEWFPLPAISRLSVSSPHLLKPFRGYNDGKDYGGQVKPFNFLLSAQVGRNGHPTEADPKRFHLISPYRTQSAEWLKGPWIDSYSGVRYRVGTGPQMNPSVARLKTFGNLLREYRTHPEPKSLGPDGEVCGKQTVGLLHRHHLHVVDEEWIGKESNRMEDVQNGLVHDWDEVVEVFASPTAERWRTVILPMLKEIPAKLLANEAGRSTGFIKRVRNGRQSVSASVRRKLALVAYRFRG